MTERAVKVKAATERLTYLIDRILTADRLLEQVDIQLQQHSLADVVKRAIAEHSFLTNKRQVDFNVENNTNLHAICDPVLVSEIVGNLLSNADKYSPADKAISVYIYKHQQNVCCQIKDQGKGIAQNDLKHIFQRYFRADTVADVTGTGIGLYVVAELAELQRGKVAVSSDEGNGSVFTLCLPCAFNQ